MKLSTISSAIVGAAVLFSVSTHAAIIDLGTITRDTSTGLDWLDVTETRGLSYNDVVAQTGQGGAYEGWRHATGAELDTLITNFGYVAVGNSCFYGVVHCDTGLPESELIETIIRTLGDTYDAFLDSLNQNSIVPSYAAGYTWGMLSDQISDYVPDYCCNNHLLARINDFHIVLRNSGNLIQNTFDYVNTFHSAENEDHSSPAEGHFLVSSNTIPLPAAAWLFGSGLLGLVGFRKFNKEV